MKILALLAALCFAALPCTSQRAGTLDIYFIDVEGGQATLFVTPGHESLLVDTGWPGHESRDAHRIVDAAKAAGLSRIDYVVISHYHDDHIGGVPQLAALIPIGTFVDHGDLYEHCKSCVEGFNAYQALLAKKQSKRLTVTPGDTLPLHDIAVTVVSSNGKVIDKPWMGAGEPNTFCAQSEIRPEDKTENGKSVGIAMSFGRFRTADLGDLTWDMERKLFCPANRLGHLSLLIVSHHGWNQSSSPAYVAAVHARAAIMDNGQKKGGSLPVLQTINGVKGLPLWQLHHSDESGNANAPEDRIANLLETNDKGNYLKVSASRDGSFTVFNARTGKSTSYPAGR